MKEVESGGTEGESDLRWRRLIRKSLQARVAGSQCAGRGAGAAPGPIKGSGRRSGGSFFRPAGGFFPWRPRPIAPPRAIGLPRGCAARAPRGARGVCGRAPRKRGENAVLGAVALPIVFGFRDGRCIGRNPTRLFHVPQNLALFGSYKPSNAGRSPAVASPWFSRLPISHTKSLAAAEVPRRPQRLPYALIHATARALNAPRH